MVIPSSLHSVLLSGQFQGWRSKSGGGASTSKTGEGQRLKKKGLKEFCQHFASSDAFFVEIQEWLQYNLENLPLGSSKFCSPFQLDELRLLDYAIEGVPFQLLFRMPSPHSVASPSAEADRYLAVEDFVHAGAQRLWEIFWAASADLKSMPLHVSMMENASSKMNATTIPGIALVRKDGRKQGSMPWENVVTFVEVQEDMAGAFSQGDDTVPGLEIVGHALFHGFQMLSSRFLAEGSQVVHNDIDIAYILCMDSQKGGVVRLKGDITKLETITDNVYVSAAEWFQEHVEIAVSPVDQVWNRFGNANWGDLGALQLLLALFYSIEQCQGPPKKSMADMAAEFSAQLQQRRMERDIVEDQQRGDAPSLLRHTRGQELEIEEEEQVVKSKCGAVARTMHLERGTILWLEDAQWQQGFQIHEQLGGMQQSVYVAVSLDDVGKLLAVNVGAHPSQLEPSWQDMSMWYQVQRQTRVLNIMKQRGVFSRFLPQIAGSGRVMHPGPCLKESPTGRCDHPWCGTPVLVTYPVGQTLASVVETEGWISADEALRCCHDCLSALRSAVSVGIQHGDISTEHVMRVAAADDEYYYVLTDWGHAVLEERDSPSISPKFSSTSALQEGRLCPASDAESLVYLLFFVCGGTIPEFNSMEAALHWRDRVWSRRAIQQQLGEVSAVLKAFADYIDSLCSTPYPVDYDIWLRRLNQALTQGDPRRMNDLSFGRSDFVIGSSATSAPSVN
ncbi:unnamed protein product [Sphagnum balticum]